MKKHTRWPFALVLGTVLALVPPTTSNAPVAASDPGGDGGQPSMGVPNPAAVYCLEVGGISKLADENIGGGAQLGLCRLHDDGVISDWTLFRAVHIQPNQAVDAFLAGQWVPMGGPIETWAEQACEAAGGQVVDYSEHLRPGSIVRLCEFPDWSLVETWTLFGGPEFYPELATLLERSTVSTSGELSEFFWHCPWPRTCMAPCQQDPPQQVLCRYLNGELKVTSFACCCCGSGVNSFRPL